jgi:hypothetical protein
MNKVKTICPSPPGFYSLRHTQFWSTWTLHTLGHSHVLIYISYVKLWTSGTPQIQDLCKNLNLHIIMLLHNKYCCISIVDSWKEYFRFDYSFLYFLVYNDHSPTVKKVEVFEKYFLSWSQSYKWVSIYIYIWYL